MNFSNFFIGLAVVVSFISLFMGGNGGSVGSSYDATTISNPWTFDEPTGTTTVTIQSTASGKGGCLAVEQNDGSGYAYFVANSTGNLATTSSCN